MNTEEINDLFETAESFAERTYKELFNQIPDTSKEAVRELLASLMQAWLTGFAYSVLDVELDAMIEEVFGFIVESDY